MSVTLTAAQLVSALRLSDSPEELAEATRLLAYATEAVTKHVADGALHSVHDEAVRRLCGYLYDHARGRPVVTPTPTLGAIAAHGRSYCLTASIGPDTPTPWP